ncbi:MAG TPA: hypothetical protein VG245_05305 [Candidatus Dormibacteraeota bacterium]|nr:hypothetical protein [Candidatus Dormibacteraeota bacterium]
MPRNVKHLGLTAETVRMLTDQELSASGAKLTVEVTGNLCAQISYPDHVVSCGCTGDYSILQSCP